MNGEEKKHESYYQLLQNKEDASEITWFFFIVSLLVWGVVALLKLNFIAQWEPISKMLYWVDQHMLVSLALVLLRYGVVIGFLWFGYESLYYGWRCGQREQHNGNPARLDPKFIQAKSEEIALLQRSCEERDLLATRIDDVRIQDLTPASDAIKKDYLVEWSPNGTYKLDVGDSWNVLLKLDEDRTPCIVGEMNEGTDAQPRWEAYEFKLTPHDPCVLYRGEGKERRIRYAVTRLGEPISEKGKNRRRDYE